MAFPPYTPTGFAATVFRDRYATQDGETFAQACRRVAGFIAQAEEGAGREDYTARFHDLLVTNRFSPGGRVWRGAGRPRGQLLNCLSGNTLVHTEHGLVPIESLAGTTAKVLTHGGVFREALWFNLGQQRLYKITLKNGDELFATANHDWITTTTRLRRRTTELVGLSIPMQPLATFEYDEREYLEGVRNGLVFGDGHLYRGGKYSMITQFGDSKPLVYEYFDNGREWPSTNASVATKLPARFKTLPALTESRSYLRGFLAGWIGADGCVSELGHVMGHNKDLGVLRKIRLIAARVGVPASSISQSRFYNPWNGEKASLFKIAFPKGGFYNGDVPDERMFVKETHRKRFIASSNGRPLFAVKVVAVEPTDRYEDVYCCFEPETHSFVIDNGYLTGNCFVWTDDLDSRESWGDALRAVTIISGTGGGVGLNFSKVRPRGFPIRGTGGVATGSVSLMRCINAVCRELREGGGRRSALMFCLRYDHPDLPEFLEVKLNQGQLENASISVLIDDEFLRGLARIILTFPLTFLDDCLSYWDAERTTSVYDPADSSHP